VLALDAIQISQVVEAGGHTRVVGAQGFLLNRQRLLNEWLSLWAYLPWS
jgi:hypothetical protein